MTAKQKLTDLKRKAIIKAATSEFYRNGYEVTSMDDIARTAGVSKRTIYNHFPAKQVLFNAIINELVERAFQNEFLQYDPKRPLREQLYIILRQETDLFLSEELMKLARVVSSELIRNPSTTNTFWDDLSRKKTETFLWLKDAVADGRLKIPSAETATRQLGGLLKEFLFWPQLMGGQKAPDDSEVEQIINSAIDMFLTYYEVKN